MISNTAFLSNEIEFSATPIRAVAVSLKAVSSRIISLVDSEAINKLLTIWW